MSIFGFRVSGFGFLVSGFWFRSSVFGFRFSTFGSQVSGIGFLISGFVCWVPTLDLTRSNYKKPFRTWSTSQVLHVLESPLLAFTVPEIREIDFEELLRV